MSSPEPAGNVGKPRKKYDFPDFPDFSGKNMEKSGKIRISYFFRRFSKISYLNGGPFLGGHPGCPTPWRGLNPEWLTPEWVLVLVLVVLVVVLVVLAVVASSGQVRTPGGPPKRDHRLNRKS